MTDSEKFYKLALNVINDESKIIGYFYNDLCYIKVSGLTYEICLNCYPKTTKMFELIVKSDDYVVISASENNLSTINEFIKKIGSVGFNRLLEGIE